MAKDLIPEIFGNFDDSPSLRGVELHASSLRVSVEDSKTSQLVMNVLKAHVRERGLGLPEDSSNVGMWCGGCWDVEMTWKGDFFFKTANCYFWKESL